MKSVERCALVKPRCSPLSAAYFSPLIHSSAEYNVPAEESRRKDDIANQVKVCWGKRGVAGGSWRGSETRRAESVEFCVSMRPPPSPVLGSVSKGKRLNSGESVSLLLA